MDTAASFKNVEKSIVDQDEKGTQNDLPPKLDPHGFPLRPQPTEDPLGESTTHIDCQRRDSNGAKTLLIGHTG
jgi:hypothetical protein